MKQRLRWIAAASAVVVTLCGCQANPEQNVVISKNDGVLEKKLTISAASEGEVAQIVWYESFLSTDGSIEYTIDLDTDIEYKPLPTLKVVPRFLTGEDVHRAAQALVPGAEFYELPSSSKMIYSKSELLAKVNRWAEYASEETAKTLFDISDQYLVPDMLEYIKEGIVYYTQKAETAPEECPHTLCQWTFQKERIYRDDPMQILGRDPADDLDVIIANALKDGVEYTINASTRNQEDYKLNTIDLQLCDGNNMTNIDLAIYRKMFCRTERPTDEQIQSVKEIAQKLLDEIDIGSWCVTTASVKNASYPDGEEYLIVVKAKALLSEDGVPILEDQIVRFQDSDVYVSQYGNPEVSIFYSANGNLIDFRMSSPIEMESVVNEKTAILSLDELMDRAKSQFALNDAESINTIIEQENLYGEELICKVNVSDVSYGLARVQIQGEGTERYYYVPALVFKGSANYYGKESGKCYVEAERTTPFLWINAVDGSVIS